MIISVIKLQKLKKRNKIIIETLYTTGVCVAELCNISVSDINFTSNQIRIIGKGNKERIVLIDESASFKLKEYLDSRITKSDYLICNTRRKNDRPLTTHSV